MRPRTSRQANRSGHAPRTAKGLSLAVVLGVLAACAGEFDTVGEALRLLQPNLPNAIVGEPYEQQVHATGGLRPYTFTLDAGALPPGISLQNGALRGTAESTGQFEFSIAVSDGNLNKTVQQYRLTVTNVPPPTFSLTPPLTEVRESVTLRASVAGARDLNAARTLITWDPAAFSLRPGSVVASGRDVAVLTEDGKGRLQVDLALLGRTLNGEHVLFSFVLEPLVETATVWVEERVEFVSLGPDPGKRHHFLRQSEGTRSPAVTDGEVRNGGPDAEDKDGPLPNENGNDTEPGVAEPGAPGNQDRRNP